MSTKEIRRVSIYQSSKVIAFMLFILVALIAIPTALYLLFTGRAEEAGLLFLIPFLYLIGFFIFYAVMFWFYNFVASKVGGVQLDFKDQI